MNATIVVREYGPAVPITLTKEQREGLIVTSNVWKKTLGLADPPLVIEQQAGEYTLHAQQVAGTIRVGSINIEIAPKFVDPQSSADWRQAFWQILIVASEGRSIFSGAQGSDAKALSIADLLAEVFLNSYSRGSLRGMPLQYSEQRDTSTTPKGNFDVHRLGEWMISPWRVPTVSDVLTDNTPVARLLGWAAWQLKSLVRRPSRARSLDKVAHELSGIGNVPSLMEAERLTLGVQHDALRQALDVAIMLLRGHGITHGEGDRDVIGFLWKTEDVYERFLFWLCQRAAQQRGLSVMKKQAQFATSERDGALTTTPDAIFRTPGGTFMAVLDAKYKNLNSSPKAADSYQVLTAANTFGCERVGLVYPTNTPRTEKKWTAPSALGGRTVEISAVFIDPCLAATPAGMRSLIAVIETWLAGLDLQARRRQDLEFPSASPTYGGTDPTLLTSDDCAQPGN